MKQKRGLGKPFKPGNPGKQKGVQNKLTRTVKETVLSVFNEMQDDPKVKLSQFAKDYPRDFYQIAAKLIPTEINAKINKVSLEIVRTITTQAKYPTPATTESD